MRSGMVQYQEDLTPLMQPIDSVIQNPRNYNNGDVEEIMALIEDIGMYRPIIVDRESREIIAGNHTWLACKQLHAEVIPVIFFDGEDEDQLRAMIGDNGTARAARPDEALLLDLLRDLDSSDRGLHGLGYNSRDIERIERLASSPLKTEDVAAEIEKQQWPTLFITIPPETKVGFYDLTSEVEGNDRERLEAIMRMAGWQG